MTDNTYTITQLADKVVAETLESIDSVWVAEVLPDLPEKFQEDVARQARLEAIGVRARVARAEFNYQKRQQDERRAVSTLPRDGGEPTFAVLDEVFGFTDKIEVGDTVACNYDGDIGTVVDVSTGPHRNPNYSVRWGTGVTTRALTGTVTLIRKGTCC